MAGPAFSFACALAILGSANLAAEVHVRVIPEVVHAIPDKLLGQFLERASWNGELGAEMMMDPATGELREDVVALVAEYDPPLVRFPFGSDNARVEWTVLIDHAPGRDGGTRPPTYQGKDEVGSGFGFAEYFALRDRLGGWETIVPVSIEPVLRGTLPVEEGAVRYGAALAAYLNAPADADLPAGLRPYVEARVNAGHPEPYGVEYLQLGNELFLERVHHDWIGDDEVASLETVLRAYIEAIRTVDPSVKLIVDAHVGDGIDLPFLDQPYFREEISLLAYHVYAPGASNILKIDGELADPDQLTEADWWAFWTSVPGFVDEAGQIQPASPDRLRQLSRTGSYPLALTEWNWNGWERPDGLEIPSGLDTREAAGLAAAAFIHGLARRADVVALATQSMFVGNAWDISTIRVEEDRARFMPTGAMAAMYNRLLGDRLLVTEVTGNPLRPQPCEPLWGGPRENPVADLDLIATRGDGTLCVHVVNRSFDSRHAVTVELSGDLQSFRYAGAAVYRPDGEGEDGLPESWNDAPASRPWPATVEPRSVQHFVFRLGGAEAE